MPTVTLTELNQHPSRVTRLVRAHSHVTVTERGVPLMEIRLTNQPASRLDQLIAAGLVSAPRNPANSELPVWDGPPGSGTEMVRDFLAERVAREY